MWMTLVFLPPGPSVVAEVRVVDAGRRCAAAEPGVDETADL